MGATTFITHAPGDLVGDAYSKAVEQAHWEYGHNGYTGTIAEKDGWIVIDRTPHTIQSATDLANKLLDEDDPRVSDKWGPAAAIRLEAGGWLFFGWASC